MRRNWNWRVWAGLLTALFAALSYVPIFVHFPDTRDFPWVNLLLFLAAGWLLAGALRRAFSQSDRYRGKVSGSIVSVVSLVIFCLFCYGGLYEVRNLPSPETAVRVGQPAPEFALTDTGGKLVTLAQLREGKRAVLLIFYRGFW